MVKIDIKIQVAIISLVTSLLTAFITTRTQLYLDKKKGRKEEIKNLISDNKEIFKNLLELKNGETINYYNLKLQIKDKPELSLLLPKKIIVLFDKLLLDLNLSGDELKEKEENIRKTAKKIVREIQKVGVDSSELKK
ncbi:hypothetical protein F6J58_05760 [Clostridium perfringens]|jgi:hypothetical protein|uniref:hypothetical protein n=1 Tax=Clostridium perfringens TaxID=1502 RepID=UPI002410471A|nr:hypothetical protein [Clostridium perfringens]MDK0688174.1 hypothetical protein [Clostridium perfringens]MDM0493660.1 hypothetical protein [Clostridium perfringens]MDM0785217.1 hypothetical protein [Clostridium perfringens]MDM0793968.1 hypothetical protein [Clostridium perfringens]MDM0802624.1 hypothetical protein [Clostridium perfringens]